MRNVGVLVIGGGPAGLAAALAAHENGARDILILERDGHLGGILQQCIHNGFGLHYFGEELTGPEYAGRFIEKLAGTGIQVMLDTMVLSISGERRVTAASAHEGLVEIQAGAIVLAMGCRERTRGALNTPGYRPAGIFTAGTAQRLVNMEGYMPGKRVVILGSGDIGLIMARRMTWEGAEVAMVCEIMPYSSGLTRNVVQCLEDNGIPLRFNYTVARIHGKERLEGVTVAEVDERRQVIPGTEEYVPCDTLLLSVGLIPENELTLGADIAMDRVTSGAVVDEQRQTSVPGIFACGNVLHVHDLVDNVSNEAALAGAAAARFAAEGPRQVQTALAVHPEGAVRYTVPQRIAARPGMDALDLYFRVGRVVKPAQVTVALGDKVLLKRKKQIMTPGEMEKITLPAGALDGAAPDQSLTLTVTEA